MAFGNRMNCGCCGGDPGPVRLPCAPAGCPTLPATIELSVSQEGDFWENCTLTYRAIGESPNSSFRPSWWSPFLQYPDSDNGHYSVLFCEPTLIGNGILHFEDWQAAGSEEVAYMGYRDLIAYSVPRDGVCDPLLLSAYDGFTDTTVTISG